MSFDALNYIKDFCAAPGGIACHNVGPAGRDPGARPGPTMFGAGLALSGRTALDADAAMSMYMASASGDRLVAKTVFADGVVATRGNPALYGANAAPSVVSIGAAAMANAAAMEATAPSRGMH